MLDRTKFRTVSSVESLLWIESKQHWNLEQIKKMKITCLCVLWCRERWQNGRMRASLVSRRVINFKIRVFMTLPCLRAAVTARSSSACLFQIFQIKYSQFHSLFHATLVSLAASSSIFYRYSYTTNTNMRVNNNNVRWMTQWAHSE